MKNSYKFLNNINFPSDIRKLSESDLQKVSDEVRIEMINAVSETGGHLGAGLGVVELTVALHYVFDTPNDKLIWDVGHQSYPHKILTGRKNKSNREIKFFENTGLNIGLLFQIADDSIDFRGDSKKAGKKTGKDKKKGKATLISLLGYKNAIKYCDKIIIDINKNLKKYGNNSKNIEETLNYILYRDK